MWGAWDGVTIDCSLGPNSKDSSDATDASLDDNIQEKRYVCVKNDLHLHYYPF